MKHYLIQLIELLNLLAFLLKELLAVAKEILQLLLSLKGTLPHKQETRMYLQNVLDYLHISERTYYRKVANGQLKPRHWDGKDYFYESDLQEQLE